MGATSEHSSHNISIIAKEWGLRLAIIIALLDFIFLIFPLLVWYSSFFAPFLEEENLSVFLWIYYYSCYMIFRGYFSNYFFLNNDYIYFLFSSIYSVNFITNLNLYFTLWYSSSFFIIAFSYLNFRISILKKYFYQNYLTLIYLLDLVLLGNFLYTFSNLFFIYMSLDVCVSYFLGSLFYVS